MTNEKCNIYRVNSDLFQMYIRNIQIIRIQLIQDTRFL